MPKLPYKERARRQREQEILKAAARMIRDNGYVNLNMDDLAEEVGISKPTLYQHFKGKDDMVAKAMLHSIQQMEDYIDELTDQYALVRLERIMRYMLEQHTDPDGFSVAIMRDGTHGLKHLTNTPKPMIETQTRVSKKIADIVQQGKTEGHIQADTPNVVIIGMMFSSLNILQGPAIMRDHSVDVKHLIDSTIVFFHRGVATPAAIGNLHDEIR